MRARAVWTLVLVGSTWLRSAAALAQGAGGSQDLETSIRAAGMGGATTAVTWGEPGPWGNPASLSSTRGIAWLEGSTRLVPELTTETRFRTQRFLAGGAGVGLSIMGDPVSGLGRTRLDLGDEWGTDPGGNLTGPWELGERIEGWGLGVSPLAVIQAFRSALIPDAEPLLPRLDVGFGYQHKRTRIVLAPGAVAEAENHDWGVNGRFVLLPGGPHGRLTRMEVSAGFAELNADERSEFDYGTGPASPSTRMRRLGFALRTVLPYGPLTAGEGTPWAWWPPAVPNAVVLGFAYDHEERSAGGAEPVREVDHWGFEASFMEFVAGRLGFVNDPDQDIANVSFGVGLRAPIGAWGSVGYDWARVPRATGLDRIDRHGWSAWLHPRAIWESTQQR